MFHISVEDKLVKPDHSCGSSKRTVKTKDTGSHPFSKAPRGEGGLQLALLAHVDGPKSEFALLFKAVVRVDPVARLLHSKGALVRPK